MSVSAEQRSKGPPVSFTDAAVIEAFRHIPDYLARDAALLLFVREDQLLAHVAQS